MSRASGAGEPARAVVVALAALLVLPLAMQKILGGNRQRSAVIGSTPTLRQVDALQVAIGVLIVATCVLLVLRRRPGTQRSVPVLAVFVVPWLTLSTTNLVEGTAFAPTAPGYLIVVFTLWWTGASLRALAPLGLIGAATAAISVLLGLFWPQLGLYANAAGQSLDSSKGLVFDRLLSGVFLSTNNLGQFLVLALPGVFLISRPWLRFTCVFVSGWAILWSGSRSSLAAMTAVLLVLGLLSILGDRAARRVAVLLLAVSAATCAALPLVAERDPTAFSGRGRIWHLALSAWWRAPWTGRGSDWFLRAAGLRTELGSRSAYTLFHGHNQFLQLVVTGGVLTALASAVMFLVVSRAALRLPGRNRAVAVAYLVAFFVSGTLELNLGIVDRYQFWATSLVPLVVIAVSGSATAATEVVNPVQEPGRDGHVRSGPVRSTALAVGGRSTSG